MTTPTPTVTEPWREAYEAWLAEVRYDKDPSGYALRGFQAGYLAALEARAQPATFTEEQIERARATFFEKLTDPSVTAGRFAMRAALSTLPAQPVRVTVEDTHKAWRTWALRQSSDVRLDGDVQAAFFAGRYSALHPESSPR